MYDESVQKSDILTLKNKSLKEELEKFKVYFEDMQKKIENNSIIKN